MIVTCSKSSEAILFLWLDLDSHVKKFFFKHTWAPSNSQYIGLKDKFKNNCLLVKGREVERKWKLFRLLSYDGTSITTYIYGPHILYAHCLLVCGHIYIHTRIWLHMKYPSRFYIHPILYYPYSCSSQLWVVRVSEQ